MTQEPMNLAGEISSASNLKRNISEKQIAYPRHREIDENDGNLLFRTETNRLRKMIGSQKEKSPDKHKKIKVLTQLIVDLEKPRAPLTIGRAPNSVGNRGSSNMHYAHTNSVDKSQMEGLGMFNSMARSQNTAEWLQGITPIKLFLASLNCQKPTP